MKTFITALLLSALSSNVFAGCLGPDSADGNDYPLGYVLNVDEHHPKTIAWHKEFIHKHNAEPDGGAFKHAICTFIVDPAVQDYPLISERRYVFVALPLARDFSEKDIRKSYSEN